MSSESTLVLNPSPVPHPRQVKRFSDLKSRIATQSTAQRPSHQSKTYGSETKNSEISEFQMEDKDTCQIDKDDDFVQERKEQKSSVLKGLSFALIKQKTNLIKRVECFMSSIADMIGDLVDKKQKRKLILHNHILSDCKRQNDGKYSAKNKITFQLIGKILREDYLLSELDYQQTRLLQVQGEIKLMYLTTINMKGCFSISQTKDLLDRINRIQEFCKFLCFTVNEYSKTF